MTNRHRLRLPDHGGIITTDEGYWEFRSCPESGKHAVTDEIAGPLLARCPDPKCDSFFIPGKLEEDPWTARGCPEARAPRDTPRQITGRPKRTSVWSPPYRPDDPRLNRLLYEAHLWALTPECQ